MWAWNHAIHKAIFLEVARGRTVESGETRTVRLHRESTAVVARRAFRASGGTKSVTVVSWSTLPVLSYSCWGEVSLGSWVSSCRAASWALVASWTCCNVGAFGTIVARPTLRAVGL